MFRDAGKYAAQYGGKASDYVKVTSDVFKSGGKTQFSVHVVMNTVTGAIHDAKTVLGR